MDTRERPRRAPTLAWAVVAVAAPLPVAVVLSLDASSAALLTAVLTSSLLLILAAVVWAIQRSRAQRREFEERFEQWAGVRAVEQERLRIARDLHDLSSHGLGIITVRAASTSYLAGPDADDERRRAMHDIERIGRSTTVELRRMLTLLRSPCDKPPTLAPADTLEAISQIVRDAESYGLLVRLVIDDQSMRDSQIPLGVQMTVCAIVREALTNVIRHAGPTTASVVLKREPDGFSVVVEDDGGHPSMVATPGPGYGLIGLRERVAILDGTLFAGKTSHGFSLRAMLPIEKAP